MDLLSVQKRFPDGFLWGASTSSFQYEGGIAEGGRGPSVVDTFRLSPKVTDFNVASDGYHHWEEDLRLAHEAGLKSYRFSISWSRIFPAGNGETNPEGVAYYRNILDRMAEYGIEPVVTIYHFDYPVGLVKQYGGWTNRRSIDDFERYCRFLFEAYGSKVRYWLTINEQDHVIRIAPRMGLTGKEPNYDALRYQANHNMCVASALAFKACHEMLPGAKIGPALSYAPIYPATNKPEDVMAASDVQMLLMDYMPELHCNGRYPARLEKYLRDRNAFPQIEPGDMELMAQHTPDYLGLNYYCTMCVAANPATPEKPTGTVEGEIIPVAEYGVYRAVKNENLKSSEYGWAIDANGMRLMLEGCYERYRLPLMITENGLGTADEFDGGQVQDDYRIAYLREHLKQLNLAINTGVEVLGYNLWSFIDLVSGREGFRKRYGLVYVDRDEFDCKTMARTPKKSYDWYKGVIATGGMALYDE